MNPIQVLFQKRKSVQIAIVVTMLLMNACAQPHMQTNMEYDIGFMNKTGKRLDGVAAYYGNNKVASKGIMVKGGCATYGSILTPLPSEAVVRWDEDGEHRMVKVKLAGVVDTNTLDRSTIYFVINQIGTVDVIPIQFGDSAALLKISEDAQSKKEYRFAFVNKTGSDIQSAAVYYGERQVGATETILKRVKIGYSEKLSIPIQSDVEVSWVVNGVSNKSKVKLNDVPKDFDGRIFFVINQDASVEACFVQNGDNNSVLKLMK